MNKENVTLNDVLEATSIRVNDALRPDKKSTNKKNNAYFWMFKCIFLILFIVLVNLLFDAVRDGGVAIIYFVGKSLRSVLSVTWAGVINFMKYTSILCIAYDQLKTFTTSTYFNNLYENDKKRKEGKEEVFKFITNLFKFLSIIPLLLSGFVSVLAIFATVYLISMFIDGMYMISPIIITLSIFVISYFAFKFIQNKFFDTKPAISKTHFLVAFIVLLVGVGCLGYETSSFEYNNGLPVGMNLAKKEKTFKIEENQRVELDTNTKLNNLKLMVDEELTDEIKIVVEYFVTANVGYTYHFNEFNDLKLTFVSDLNMDIDNIIDVANLFVATFNNKTIYNYNLFKYPNIYVYANSKTMERIKVE